MMRAMLISCVAYQDGRKLADIPKEDISDYVGRRDCFVWVALFEPSMEELDEMAPDGGVGRDGPRVLAARARGRGCPARPPASEDRGVWGLAVRRAPHHRAR